MSRMGAHVLERQEHYDKTGPAYRPNPPFEKPTNSIVQEEPSCKSAKQNAVKHSTVPKQQTPLSSPV